MNEYHSSPEEIDLSEVDRLLAAMERGEIAADEEQRLESLVCSSAAARQRYVLGLGLIASLEWEVGTSSKFPAQKTPTIDLGAGILDPSHSDSPLLGEPLSDLPPPPFLASSNPSTTSWLNWFGRTAMVGFAAWMIAAIVLGAWIWFNHHQANQPLALDDETAEAKPDEPRLAQEEPSRPDPAANTYVARIVKASTDCRWGRLTTPVEFLVRVRAGDQMHIAAGLVELEFYSGARVILHGPTVFTPTGIASGHLESGRLTGEVADGNFRLMTPAAEVIDLGTAFGVAADAAVGTDVVVFDGRVQVVSVTEGGRPSEPLDMTEGMAARFRVDGSTEYGLHTDAAQFKRVVSSSRNPTNANEICLIDVIAGGDGSGARLAGAIDPLSGEKDYGEREQRGRFRTPRSKGKYHPSPWNAIVDGVFIPSQRGQRVPVTSRGLKIDLPPCNGQSWGPIWARRKDSLPEAVGRDFWGDLGRTEREGSSYAAISSRLRETRNGLAGMHSNVGITFDLQAVRLLHRQGPAAFRAAVANFENSRIGPLPPHVKVPPSASFYIYVDGELKYERLGFRGEDGEEEFAVPLTVENRFLTIVSTDHGDGFYYDHVVLIDPIIELTKEF